LDSAWGTELQSQTVHGPAGQLDGASVWPAIRSAAAWAGSLSSMLEWMFRVTSMPRWRAQPRKDPGSGKSVGFHSHPFQSSGAFQSVSRDRVSSGTWFAVNAGYTVSSMSAAE